VGPWAEGCGQWAGQRVAEASGIREPDNFAPSSKPSYILFLLTFNSLIVRPYVASLFTAMGSIAYPSLYRPLHLRTSCVSLGYRARLWVT